MPHQCVKCGKIYDDGSRELLSGCSVCNSKFFFFIKKESLKSDFAANLSKEDIDKIERDIRGLIPEIKSSEPVILDIETIRIVGPGKYEIDIGRLMRGKPVIIQAGEGKYYIDLSTAMKK
jgi:hypothetical protein